MTTEPQLSLYDRGPPPPCPERFNLARHTLQAAGAPPDKIALEIIHDPAAPSDRFSYADLLGAVGGTMTGLRDQGMQPGDRVLLRLDHTLDFPLLFFAATGIGALPVPTSPQLTKGEISAIAAALSPRLTIASPGIAVPEDATVIDADTAAAWRDLPGSDFADTARDDPAYIIFTSGTGGRTKGVVHAHRAAWARRMMWDGWYGLGPADRLLHAGAFNWTYTLGTGLTDPWAAGATALIHAGPRDRGVWASIAHRHSPTIFAAAPGVYRQLLSTGPARDAFASLRHGLSAGEAMPDPLRRAWQQLTGTPILEALGMSEVSTYISQSPGNPVPLPQPGRRVAVLDPGGMPLPRGTDGELAVSDRDPGLMLGYWRADAPPDLPLSGEWFRTGDRARMAQDDAITHLGRLDDILNAQGYRVSAREIETVLQDHPAVAEAAATTRTVRQGVAVLAALVVPHEDVSNTDLAAHCARHLARYKVPRDIRIVDALPRTATGKIARHRLADWQPPHKDPQ